MPRFCALQALFDRPRSSTWVGLPALLLLFCSTSSLHADEPSNLTRRDRGNLAIGARAILKRYCGECHGGNAVKQGTIAVLNHATLVNRPPELVPFVLRKDAEKSQIIQLIEDGSMPPGNRPRPTPEETDTLKKWIGESAPSYPAAFDEQYTLKVMLDDVGNQPENSRPYLRYFSLAHLVTEESDTTRLGLEELKLRNALTWCNPKAKTTAEPVDDTATLFRFDTRKISWDSNELFFRTVMGAPKTTASLTPYDLVLLEYPFGFQLPADYPETTQLNDYFKAAKLVQPIPFLRADWLAETLGRGQPLAEDLKSLVELNEALKKQGLPILGAENNMPCGPETRAFAGLNPVPAAPKPTADLPILPLGAWYSGNCQTEPPPFKLTARAINSKRETLTAIGTDMQFKLEVTASQDIHFVLLVVRSDGAVLVQPTNKNGFLKADEKIINPSEKGAFQIASILTGEKQANEYFILLASPTPLPPPTLVKSRHSSIQIGECGLRFPISRFYFDPEVKKDGFDPAKVVRVVIPITVLEK